MKTGVHAPMLVAVGLSGCAVAPKGDAPGTPDHHHEGHDPLVHRFERAAEWAPIFDDPGRDEWQRPSEVVSVLKLAAGAVVADVGAGTGYFEPYLSRAVTTTGRVLAVDIEPDMVRYLGERAARENLANVEPILAAADDPRLPAGQVDRVLVVDTWHHIPQRVAYAKKLRASLRPGGTITVVELTTDAKRGPPKPHRIAPEQLIAELVSAGLAAEVVEETLPDHYIVVARQPGSP